MAVTSKLPGQRSWKGTHIPNCSPCGQTVRLHCDDCRHFVLHHSRTVRFVRLQSQPTSHMYLSLCAFLWLQHWLTHCSHSRKRRASALYCSLPGSCDLAHQGLFCPYVFVCAHLRMLRLLLFLCLPSLPFSSQMEEQQNMQQSHGTTWWNHSHYTGFRLSALHSLSNIYKLVRARRPLCRHWPQESNGTAISSCVSSPQLPHSDISSQVLAGPTRIVTGDVMSATLAEAATQLAFAEFSERCNLLGALPLRPQPNPTLLLDAATQIFPHSAASAHPTPARGVLS